MALVRKDMFNRPECQHDEGEGEYSAGGVDAVARVSGPKHKNR